jgi:hypothetical protein
MIRKSVKRFSEKIMRKQKEERRLRLYRGLPKRKRRPAAPLKSVLAAG